MSVCFIWFMVGDGYRLVLWFVTFPFYNFKASSWMTTKITYYTDKHIIMTHKSQITNVMENTYFN
jgi:hypothetical protein